MGRVYKLHEGSVQEAFQNSRAKVQMFGGGYGNGKTTSAVVKALQLAKQYPGSNGLIARSTYPKLNDTIRKEWLAWCPKVWIESKNLSKDNTVTLTNGSTINFRYIAQQGKANESSTSNLLSATYDYIVVDQVEDPEISHKDFLDLLGRLRGNARYIGDDATMPVSGPRWMILCTNPTRNWVYRELVKPLHDYKKGRMTKGLLVDKDNKPIIDLFEGSTYSNKENLPEDFIEGLESAYTGQMKERFLMGEWGAFEGLVYPEYSSDIHLVPREKILAYMRDISYRGWQPRIIEAYDHGIAAPACYGLAFSDMMGNVFITHGFHIAEQSISSLATAIKKCRTQLDVVSVFENDYDGIIADPAIFKRASGTAKKVGTTVAGLFAGEDISMVHANNSIITGIMKVKQYLTVDLAHRNPFDNSYGSPKLFIASELDFIDKEITDYIWKRDTSGEFEDKPRDINDHSLDMIKYMLSRSPKLAGIIKKPFELPTGVFHYHEVDIQQNQNARSHRYGA